MKRIITFAIILLVIYSFRGVKENFAFHEGMYGYSNDSGMGHAWSLEEDVSHPGRIKFLTPHDPRVVFRAVMVDHSHFRSRDKFILHESNGNFLKVYATQGEFIDSGNVSIRFTCRPMLPKTAHPADTTLEYIYVKMASRMAPHYIVDVLD